jgi:uncharacterized protein (DUF305 family)
MPAMQAAAASARLPWRSIPMVGGVAGAGVDIAVACLAVLAFIDMMTAHHRAAIQMANTELRDGSPPQAKDLAQQIIDAQQTEIHQLQRWKQDWSVPPIR